MLSAILIPYSLTSTDATWTNGAMTGAWNNNGNWTGGVFPDATDDIARFEGAGPPGFVTLNTVITLGTLNITASGYTIFPGGGSLQFMTSGANAALNSVSSQITAPIELVQDLDVNVGPGGSSLDLTGIISGVGQSIQKSGAGRLTLTGANTYSGGTEILDGDISISANNNLGTGPLTFSSSSGGGVVINSTIANFNHPVTINANSTGVFFLLTPDIDLTITSQISGPGTLALIGLDPTNSVTLSNPANNYGGTTFAIGVGLIAGAANVIPSNSPLGMFGTTSFDLQNFNQTIAGLNGNGTINLGSATLTLGDSLNYSFSGSPILGTGGITKQGTGIQTLSGTMSYTGATLVNAGRLQVFNGLASPVTVASGASLRGLGSFQAITISSGATIIPGFDETGVLTTTSLTLDPNSTLLFQITPTSTPVISVTGAAALGGTIQLDQESGDYGTSGDYVLMTFPSSATGSFNSSVQGGLPGFAFSLNQLSTSLLLHYEFEGIPTAGLTGNASAFARYLNNNVPNSSATLALMALSGETLENALNSASPARNAFVPFTTQNTMFALSEVLNGHLANQRFYRSQKGGQPNLASLFADTSATQLTADSHSGIYRSSPCNKYTFWVGAFGEYSHQKAQEQNPAFNFYSGGGLVAFDYYGTDHNLIGCGGGYAHTQLSQDNDAGRASINYYFGNIYDTIYFMPLYLEFAVWGTYNQTHNHRHISFPGFDETASATITTWQLVPHFGFGYQAQYCWGAFEPFAQFDLAVNWQESFQEHGAGAFDMSQTSLTSQFLRSEAGFRFYEGKETNWGAWMILEKISFVNKKTFRTGNVSSAIVGTTALFSVESFRNTQNLGSAGIEFLWRRGQKNPVTFSLAYNGEFGSQYWSQEGIIRLEKDF